MQFGSVCSGIEAASVAWHGLGWRAAWVSEIEAFPSAVLEHHWPEVPNLGDMLRLPARVAAGEITAPDVLVGGTPCQAFSVAGKRGSLEDERGALTLAYVELANEIDEQRKANGDAPCVIVWENVPGVLNTKDNAFGCFLAGLAGEDEPLVAPGGRWSNAGCVFGPERTVAWRVLDAQYFGVAQRRRRVFVVASARDGFDPSEILFEREGVRRDSAPRREARKETADDAGLGFAVAGSHWDAVTKPHPSLNQSHNTGGIGASNQEIFSQRGSGLTWPADVASTLNAAFGDKQGREDQHVNGECPLFVPAVSVTGQITHALNTANNGKGSSEDGTGRGVPTVAIPVLEAGARTGVSTTDKRAGMGVGHDGDPMFTLQAGKQHGIAHTVALRASTGGGDKPHVITREPVIYDTTNVTSPQNGSNPQPGARSAPPLLASMAVRRLTPTECERLQGFPDGHTDVPYRNKPAADGPRYKALGNSMAVPVMAWIGQRIQKAVKGGVDAT